MRDGSRRTIIAIILVFLMAASGLTGMLGSADDEGSLVGGPGLFDTSPWVDDFDNTNLVNDTIDTVVVGGQVELAAGKANGLVASVPITAPAGYRYDILILEVDTPGSSSVKVSVLNATEESTKVGYVNEPVPGFLKLDKIQVPMSGLSPKLFPQLRLQADLESSGTDRPALLKWTLYYVASDTWRDEFWGDGKVDDVNRVVFDGEYAMVDMSMGNLYVTGYADHDDYPPIFANRYHNSNNRLEMGVFYTNAAGNGYQARTQMSAENAEGFVAGDLDEDGNIDMVVANYRNGNDYTRDSYILWGDAAGAWDVARRTNLATDRGREPAVGDVNGDGNLDVLIVNGQGSSSGQVRIWLNPGSRTWNNTHDMTLSGTSITAVAAADLDQDGYDDVVVAENYDAGSDDSSRLYYGSPTGPDNVADETFPTGSCGDVALGDYNGDGWTDIAFANTIVIGGNDRASTFFGSPDGYDIVKPSMQFQADVPDNLETIAAGDINGDGYDDWVVGRVQSGPRMWVYWGAASGLSDARSDNPGIVTSMRDNIVIDMNNDGYDDVLSAGSWQDRVDIYNGGSGGIDGTSDMNLDTNDPTALGVAVGPAKLTSLRGSFVSNVINRPLDQKWDILVLEGDFPAFTDMEVSVLDTGLQPILGYSGLKGPDIDLSGVTIPGIHIKVTLISNDMVTSPRLDRMFVKWMDKNVWREEYFGYAKIDQVTGLIVTNGEMIPDTALLGGKEIVFSNLRDDGSYQVMSTAFRDAGGMDYTSVVVADANGDGYSDVLFPVLQTSSSNYIADSPLFTGSPTGFDTVPTHKFPSIGARDALVADLNKDGYMDVVFAQEQNSGEYTVNSTLFWGDEDGWNSTADVEFVITGASGVVAADFDKDGLLDLAFACFRNTLTTAIDSVVFLQTASGFDGSSADRTLPTKGARGVAVGDIDENGWQDLVFANSISGGFVDIFSSVFWGGPGGTFGATPANVPTRGAEGVLIADVNGDNDLDLVFANSMDNTQSRTVDSFIYLGTGSQTLSVTADISLPTVGANAVTAGDIDGTGWMDLVFACHFDGATYDINSRVYLGGASGYGSTPDIELPTHGASGVVIADLVPKDKAGYLSQVIKPVDSDNAGVFEIFRYNAVNLPAGHTGTIYVLDANTGEVLATTILLAGVNEWSLADKFRIREHDAIQIMITVNGLNPSGSFAMDDLWLNWSPRSRAPPQVLGLKLSETSVLRTKTLGVLINVTDEYDFLDELTVLIQHRRSNTTDPWNAFMVTGLGFVDDTWKADLNPRVDIPVGMYDLRVMATDSDGMDSGWQVHLEMFEVLNNLPTAPEVQITPARATVTQGLDAIIVSSAYDVESPQITYDYTWFLDGVLVPEITTNHVAPSRLLRGQNWSVEVRANDTDDLGPSATAWKLIGNAPPFPATDLPDPSIEEDTPDSDWLVLLTAFDDPDGDPLVWRVDPPSAHFTVEIDPVTGRVTLTPEANWHGSETIIFVASDGEFEASQSVTVTVTAVNDIPVWVTINGDPYDGGVIELGVTQGDTLTIDVLAFDVEGDDLLFRVSDTQVILDLTTGQMTFFPDNDDIGWLNFSMTVNDNVEPSKKIQADFSVLVLNVNDAMEPPRIISPSENDAYKWNESVGLRGVCIDPDEQHGQVLNFSWSSNQSGHIGYGPSINYRFTEPGHHIITLTVTDGEFVKERIINISVGHEAQGGTRAGTRTPRPLPRGAEAQGPGGLPRRRGRHRHRHGGGAGR